MEKNRRAGPTITHVLCTHHHPDHAFTTGVPRALELRSAPRARSARSSVASGSEVAHRGEERLRAASYALDVCKCPCLTRAASRVRPLVDGAGLHATRCSWKCRRTVHPAMGASPSLRHSFMEVLMSASWPWRFIPAHTDPTTIARGVGAQALVRACARSRGHGRRDPRRVRPAATLLVAPATLRRRRKVLGALRGAAKTTSWRARPSSLSRSDRPCTLLRRMRKNEV